jgi:hypothetical protein
LGLVALADGTYENALQLLQKSHEAQRKAIYRDQVGWALASLPYAERGLGRRGKARQHLAEALQLAVEKRAFFPLIHALPVFSLLLVDAGQVARAVELYALASRYGFVANSQLFQDMAGRHIASTAESLAPDVLDAAQERGRARDLWKTAAELLAELEESEG